jgi:hypothetical protein
MCNIWWPTFGSPERSLFLSLSLSLSLSVFTMSQHWINRERRPVSLLCAHRYDTWRLSRLIQRWDIVQRQRERQRGSFQRCQMQVTKYYTLAVLALLAAHHIFHISRIGVKNISIQTGIQTSLKFHLELISIVPKWYWNLFFETGTVSCVNT